MEPASAPRERQSRKNIGVGFWIWWRRPDNSPGGPSQIWMIVLSKQRRWAYVESEGNGIWVCEDRITEVVRGSGRPVKRTRPSEDA